MFSLLFVMALDISAQQPPARPIPPPRDSSATTATGTAVIGGRLFAAGTKKPLRRARIVVSSPELGQDRRQTSTNIDGRFEVKDLPAGRYTVEVQRAGYLPLRYGQRRPREAAKPLQVLDRQRLDDIDFTLPRMSVIARRVFDETSEAGESATVVALRCRGGLGQGRPVPG